MVTPTMFPVDKKASSTKKSLGQQCINSFLAHKLSHNCWLVWFLGGGWEGAYGSLPDAAIWWCLRTGGGGVLTSTLLVALLSPPQISGLLVALLPWLTPPPAPPLSLSAAFVRRHRCQPIAAAAICSRLPSIATTTVNRHCPRCCRCC